MKTVMWVIRLVVFMVVLWLALANQHNVQVFAPMGQVWQGPLVWVLLITLLLGVALGVFFMVPAWWAQRRATKKALAAAIGQAAPPPPANPLASPATASDDNALGI